MKPLWRRLFTFDDLMVTLGVCVAVGMLFVLPKNFTFLSPVAQALGDLDLTDMVFTEFRDDSHAFFDSSIVIVNIGRLSREEIAQEVRNISRHQPRAIGIDAFFRAPKDPTGDSLLADAFRQAGNVVLVSKVSYNTDEEHDEDRAEQVFDTLELSAPMFASAARHGFANLVVDQQEAFMTCREVTFAERYQGGTEESFPLVIAGMVDDRAHRVALDRKNETEVVNYRGNLSSFYSVDADLAIDSTADLSFLRGKIVLMGYLGPTFAERSLEDAFFTPLNPQYVGRSYPDMYGIVVHANVLSMILRGDYINKMSVSTGITIGMLLLIVNVMVFSFVFTHIENWYDTIALVLQVGQSILIFYLLVTVFATYNYKLYLTPSLFGVALVGTVHDLYRDSIKKLFLSARDNLKRRFSTKQRST